MARRNLSIALETVTPSTAQAMLETNTEHNRTVSRAHIDRLVNAMRAGLFIGDATGETIKFAEINGRHTLIDGQHRLQAIVQSGVTMKLWVARGLDPDAFKLIDQGKPRTLDDMMVIGGTPFTENTKVYSSAGRMLFKEDVTGDPRVQATEGKNSSEGVIYEYICDHYLVALPDRMNAYRALMFAAQKAGAAPASLWLYMAVRCAPLDPALFNRMISYAADPMGGAPCSMNFKFALMRALKLREEARADAGRVLKGSHKDMIDGQLAAWACAWNLTREGTHLRSQSSFTREINLHAGKWQELS